MESTVDNDSVSIRESDDLIVEYAEEPTIYEQSLQTETLCRPRQSPLKKVDYSILEKERNNTLRIWFQENLKLREDEISQYILVLQYSGVSSPQQLSNKILRDKSYLARLDFLPVHMMQIYFALNLPAPLLHFLEPHHEAEMLPTTAPLVIKDMKKWLQAHTTADAETIHTYDFILRFSSISTEDKLKAKLIKNINFLHERDFSIQHIKQIRQALSMVGGSDGKATSSHSPNSRFAAQQQLTKCNNKYHFSIAPQDTLDDDKFLSAEDRALLSHLDIAFTVFRFIRKHYKMRKVHDRMKCFQRIASGDYFHGALDENLCRQGDGICFYKNGDYYEGSFQSDAPEGYGEMKYSNGSNYRGMFSEGLRHGKGMQTYPNGDLFRGFFNLGQRSGQGRCEYSAGGWYEGEYLMNRKHGHGVMLSGDGSRYEGQFKDGKKSGNGVLLYANKDVYSGEFLEDRKNGHGRYQYFVDGSVYEGGFLNGLAHGHGSIRRPMKMKTNTAAAAAENKLAVMEMADSFSSPSRRFVQKEGDWREGKMLT